MLRLITWILVLGVVSGTALAGELVTLPEVTLDLSMVPAPLARGAARLGLVEITLQEPLRALGAMLLLTLALLAWCDLRRVRLNGRPGRH